LANWKRWLSSCGCRSTRWWRATAGWKRSWRRPSGIAARVRSRPQAMARHAHEGVVAPSPAREQRRRDASEGHSTIICVDEGVIRVEQRAQGGAGWKWCQDEFSFTPDLIVSLRLRSPAPYAVSASAPSSPSTRRQRPIFRAEIAPALLHVPTDLFIGAISRAHGAALHL
jgi:hypothetical protein